MSVQSFANDRSSATGWPPRSYTCSFCGKELRSAQALGGHMNVHRLDRARLRQSIEDDANNSATIFSSPEFIAGNSITGNSIITYSVTHTDYSPYRAAVNSPIVSPLLDKVGMLRDHSYDNGNSSDSLADGTVADALDLELRLWW